jgi:hypothetical protein
MVEILIHAGVNLSMDQCPKTQEEEEDISHVPYVSAVGRCMK